MHHRVTCLVLEPAAPFEVGVVCEVFAQSRPELEVEHWYELTVCGERPGQLQALGGLTLGVQHGLEALEGADTIVVPGAGNPVVRPSEEVCHALRAAHRRGARMVSICSGTFVLAAAGLLDGRRASTHWRYADALATRYPQVAVDADVLFVDEGDIVTSAGTAAGIDACLHLVRADHGATIAGSVARRMVVAPHREGGQAQFVDVPVAPAPGDDPIGRAMEWAIESLDQPISIAELARCSHMSTRSFTRHFTATVGVSPGRWLLDQRVHASLALLEAGHDPIEHVGAKVGIAAPAAFRRHFAARMGVSPSAYRRAFRGPAHPRRATAAVAA